MKILLAYPKMRYVTGDPPLGIAYVASYIKKRGFKVKILDTTFNHSWSFVEKTIRKENPEILGIYSVTTMLKDALRTADIGKANGVPLVVLGGPHPSVCPEDTLGNKSVDAVVVGEGEYSFYKIAEIFERGGDIRNFAKIPNVYFKLNGKIKKNKERHFIKNLDDIPFPSRELLDMENYIKYWFQMDAVAPGLNGTSIFTSRSCPYECTFCQPTVKKMFGSKIRRRSPENIIEELKYLKKKYRINAFQIYDDIFLIDNNYVKEFCERMTEEDLNLIWACHARANIFPSSETINKMYKAGLRMVGVGIESGSYRILDMYNKRINLEQVKTIIKSFRKHGIKVRGFFIMGAPTETPKEMKRTISFAVNSRIDEATFSILCPFPGTYIYEMAKKRGWKISEDWDPDYYYSRSAFKSGTLPEKLINRYQQIAMILFYSHPFRLRYLLNSLLQPRRSYAKIKTYFI